MRTSTIKDGGTDIVSFRAPRGFKEQATNLATEHGFVSMSEFIRFLVRQFKDAQNGSD